MGHDDEPECEHECSRCSYVGEGLEDCANANCEQARGDNGFCPDCRSICHGCDAVVCDSCFELFEEFCEECCCHLCPACARYSTSAQVYYCRDCYSDHRLSSDDEEEEEEQIEYY
jgi:hypothetical protein